MHSPRLTLVSILAVHFLLIPSALLANEKCRNFVEWNLEDAESKVKVDPGLAERQRESLSRFPESGELQKGMSSLGCTS